MIIVSILTVLVLLFLSFLPLLASYDIDPSDFFTGAQNRPRLEILYPENGQVLDDIDLEIKINIEGNLLIFVCFWYLCLYCVMICISDATLFVTIL